MSDILQFGDRFAIVRDNEIERFRFISNPKRIKQAEWDRARAAPSERGEA